METVGAKDVREKLSDLEAELMLACERVMQDLKGTDSQTCAAVDKGAIAAYTNAIMWVRDLLEDI